MQIHPWIIPRFWDAQALQCLCNSRFNPVLTKNSINKATSNPLDFYNGPIYATRMRKKINRRKPLPYKNTSCYNLYICWKLARRWSVHKVMLLVIRIHVINWHGWPYRKNLSDVPAKVIPSIVIGNYCYRPKERFLKLKYSETTMISSIFPFTLGLVYTFRKI